MPTVLLTFLGRTPREKYGYRKTIYDFGNGSNGKPVAFFGWALTQRIQPQRLVILGTPGSMWDHLFEGDLPFGTSQQSLRDQLYEAVEDKQVYNSLLQQLEALLEQHMNCEVKLVLIPYAKTESEQVELLSIMAQHVETTDQVHLDITHGFRHLPMLALLSAFHLRTTRESTIAGIWYAAYDEEYGVAPVHNLNGLLKIADWLDALSVYEHTSNYGQFAKLIGGEIGDHLANAAFYESINRVGEARGEARKARKLIIEQQNFDPVTTLFVKELLRRLDWSVQQSHYQRQRQLAVEFLHNQRFMESVLVAYEAFITRLARQQNLEPTKLDNREVARKQYDAQQKLISPRAKEYKSWDSLRRLRNAMAHGSQPKGPEVQQALSDFNAMQQLMTNLIETLLPENS